jgi:methyl-accepting chemotaxis protein
MRAVDSGVARSRAAGEALEHIRNAARDASDRVAEIARASEEQGRSSQNLAEAARRSSDHVQEITAALAEQAVSAERLLENAGTSVQMCQQMASAADEQRAACLDIAANGESISERIKSIQHATANHERTRQDAARTLESLIAIAQQGAARLPELGIAVETTRAHGQELTNAMTRFDEPDGDVQSIESPR